MNDFEELFSEKGLSLERLWTLVKVAASNGSLIKAAHDDPGRAALYSRQIAQLSDFFGANLTQKDGKSFCLSSEGIELTAIVRESFLKMADFRARCSENPKHFSIGAGDSLLHWLVIPRLAAEAGLKEFTLSLHNLQNTEIINGLSDLTLDFGLARTSAAVQPLERLVLGDKTYALYVPKALLDLGDGAAPDGQELLQTIPLAAQAKYSHFQREFEKRSKAANLELSIRLHCESVPEVVRALKTEQYAAVLHRFASKELDPAKFQQVSLPLLDDLAFQVALVWNPKLMKIRRPAAERLKAILKKALKFSGSSSEVPPPKDPGQKLKKSH